MRVSTIFLFVCFFFNIGSAQNKNWGKLGDEWRYTLSEEYWPSTERPLLYKTSTVTVTSTNNSVNGENCNNYTVTNPDSCNLLIGTFSCYTRNRVTYYYHEDSNAFYPLYDFNMFPGDSLITPTNEGTLITYLDSLGSIKVDDTALTVQYIHYTGEGLVDHATRLFSFYPKNEVFNIEEIGNTVNFFPWWNGFCHNIRAINLRCFNGENLQYTYAPEWEGQCDSTFYWGETSVKESSKKQLSIFPNPATSTITVSGLNQINGSLQLYQADGTLVFSQIKTDGSKTISIDVSAFDSGLYYIVHQSKRRLQASRFIIE